MMNSQSFHGIPRADLIENRYNQPEPPRRERTGPLRWLWQRWVRLTGPRPERFGSGIVGQERLRRSRLTSALLLLIVISLPTLVPSAFVQPLIWRPLVVLAVGVVLVALLNREALVTTSGFAYIILVDGAIAGYVYTKPIFTFGNIPNLDLFILTILIAGMVLPRQLIPVVALLHIGLVVAIFNLKPHDIYLQDGIRDYFDNQPYTAIVNAILLQVSGAGIAWLHAWSVSRAIVRASRAEELAEARAHIDVQARQIADQKARLEQGIRVIQEVQARVANGEYSARVSLQNNELLPLGVSFNLMAERLGRVERVEQEYQRLENALQQLNDTCDKVARGLPPAPPRATGTMADRVFPFLVRLHQLSAQLNEGSALAEDLRAVLERQIAHLSLAETRLIGSLSLAKDLAIETMQALPHAAGGISGGLPEGHQAKGEAGATHISSLLDQQITLLEQVKKYDEQARTLGTRCMQGAHILSQRLKEAG